MKCIVLAGGFGTRLKTVVSDLPKPMAPIGGHPFVELLMRHLKQFGVREFILSTHHMHDAIEGFLGGDFEGTPVRYAFEAQPLGTGGGIVHSLAIARSAEPVMVVNGDTFVKLDYAQMYREHIASGAQLSMALRHIPDTGRSGVVTVNGDTITSFGARGTDGVPGLINAGVYIVSPGLFEGYKDGDAFSFETDFMAPRAPALGAHAYMADDYFIDIGIPADYARAQRELAEQL